MAVANFLIEIKTFVSEDEGVLMLSNVDNLHSFMVLDLSNVPIYARFSKDDFNVYIVNDDILFLRNKTVLIRKIYNYVDVMSIIHVFIAVEGNDNVSNSINITVHILFLAIQPTYSPTKIRNLGIYEIYLSNKSWG